MPNKISAVIIAFNEEKNIARCIHSLFGIADEIVVVDSFSSDRTKSICEDNKVKFIQNKFEGHIEQKNFALQQARYDYVLSLDADESLSEELKQSILEAKQNFEYDAYTFNRLTNYCGKWIKHSGWYPDRKLRLWKKSQGRWGGTNPHDKVILNTSVKQKQLSGDLLHYSFDSIDAHDKQIDFFTDISAREAFKKGERTSYVKLIFKPLFKFIRDYFFKLGFLDGYFGLLICLKGAKSRYLKYLKLGKMNKARKSKNQADKNL